MKKGFKELIRSETPTLVDFYADWCGPCKAMSPVLEQVAASLGDKVKIIKINVDKNQAVAAAYKVQSIPTFILFKNGEVKWRKTGGIGKSQLESMVNQHVNK